MKQGPAVHGLVVDVDHRQGAFRLEGRFVAPRGVTALFGRSGSGKSTLVNIVAGLIRPDRGHIAVNGTVLVDTASGVVVPRHRRGIGYVFQEARLFPHLDVRQNLLFGRWFSPRRDTGASLDDVVELLGIGALLGRRPGALSGGERQRVAIGRALLSRPRLLLMDEPLAALDDERKAEILPFIERLRDHAGVPIVYVSHSIAEVARLADTLVVLEAGRITASGPAEAMLSSRSARALAGDREAGAVLDAVVAAQDECFRLTDLSTPAGTLRVPSIDRPIGARLRVRVPARDVMLSVTKPEGLSALNILPGTIADLPLADPADRSASVEICVLCGEASLLVRITRRSLVDLGLTPGRPIFAIVKSVALEPGSGPNHDDGRFLLVPRDTR